MNKHIIIIGAGVAGLTLASLLAKYSNHQISMIEASSLDINLPSKGISARVSALNAYSQAIFKALDIYPALSARSGAFDHITVWESAGQSIDFEQARGILAENDHIRQLLLEQLQANPSVSILSETLLNHITQENNQVSVHLSSKQVLQGDLLVAADGANSFVRKQANFTCNEQPYGHDAIVCHITTEHPHNNTARQWFLPAGPLALLPLKNPHQCSIVWSNKADRADYLMQLNEDAFKQELSAMSHFELGNVTQCTPRYRFPLTMRHAKQYLNGRIILVGDAAHTIHPLAGQGMNLGIQDVVSLADRLIDRTLTHASLRGFERERKAHNAQMLLAMQTFKTLFGLSAPSIQSIISAGVGLAQKTPPLKSWMMKMASGPVDELPVWLGDV